MNLEGSMATDANATHLAAMNQPLIRDEGHRNAMPVDELERRMKTWLAGEYEAAIFWATGVAVGYSRYKREADLDPPLHRVGLRLGGFCVRR